MIIRLPDPHRGAREDFLLRYAELTPEQQQRCREQLARTHLAELVRTWLAWHTAG